MTVIHVVTASVCRPELLAIAGQQIAEQRHVRQDRVRWIVHGDANASYLDNIVAALEPSRHRDADLIVFWDDDDWFSQDWLAACKAATFDEPLAWAPRRRWYHIGMQSYAVSEKDEKKNETRLIYAMRREELQHVRRRFADRLNPISERSDVAMIEELWLPIKGWIEGSTRPKHARDESLFPLRDDDGSVLDGWIGRRYASMYRDATRVWGA